MLYLYIATKPLLLQYCQNSYLTALGLHLILTIASIYVG